MYAIPAETATQGQPFQKDTLPGPGMFDLVLTGSVHTAPPLLSRVHCSFVRHTRRAHRAYHLSTECVVCAGLAKQLILQMHSRRKSASAMDSNYSSVRMTEV